MNVEIVDLFNVLVLCTVDVSRCTEPHHAIREPIEVLRKYLAPDDERQLHRYNELAGHEDRYLILKINDLSFHEESWPYLPLAYRDRSCSVKGYLGRNKALSRIVADAQKSGKDDQWSLILSL